MNKAHSPTVLKKSFIETKGIEHVRTEEATGKPIHAFWLWFAANTGFVGLATGALTTGIFGLSIPMAVLAITVGTIIGSLLLAKAGTFGIETGLPQMIQGVGLFGKYGNRFPAFLNFFVGFSWFAVNTTIGAYALYSFFHLSPVIGVLILSVIQVFIALIGHDFIHATQRYLTVILLAVFAIFTFFAAVHFAGHLTDGGNALALKRSGGPFGAFITAMAVATGGFGWTPYSSDYTRYMNRDKNPEKTKKAVFWYIFWGSAIPTIWLEAVGAVIGAFLVLNSPEQLIVTGWLPHWFLAPFIIAIILGVIGANVPTIYSGTLSALSAGFKLKQPTVTLITGLIGLTISLLTVSHFFTDYMNFLLLLGYWITPWITLVLLAHALPGRKARFKNLNPGFTAWLLASLSSVIFMNQTLYVGIFAKAFPQAGDITFGVTALIAVLLYLILSQKKPALTEQA